MMKTKLKVSKLKSGVFYQTFCKQKRSKKVPFMPVSKYHCWVRLTVAHQHWRN